LPAEVEVQPVTARCTRRLGARRDRQAVKTAGANLVSLGANYAIRLAVIPLSLALLGTERYGLFLAVGSLVAWGGLADLGFAPGLVNVVATATGRDDREAIRRYISRALAAYSVSAGTLACLVTVGCGSSALTRVLGVREPPLGTRAHHCGLEPG